MHPGVNGLLYPNKPAIIMSESEKFITHGELNELSNQGAQLFRSLGLKPGDSIALMLENHLLFFPIIFAAWRSGLRYTAISWRLQANEVEYIVEDCNAKVFITSKFLEENAAMLKSSLKKVHSYMLDGVSEGFSSYEESISSMPISSIKDECQGGAMLYSSGTTGRPKGIHRKLTFSKLPYLPEDDDLDLGRVVKGVYGGSDNSIYLSPAPLYHSAPLGFNTGFLSLGSTSIIMEKFETQKALKAIEKYKVTHSQWVPTMFVRFLKMEEDLRRNYDISSLEVAIHAAAPCPIAVKEQMIDWWGPIIYEYYAGTEYNGMTIVDSNQWLSHKGTVGKPLFGELHILDEDGNEVEAGETGVIYFGGPTAGTFEYHNDEGKTSDAISSEGYSTLGDIGYVDKEGFLYLTDRKSFMIISGGVNIYPKETEDLLVMHPKVEDVAVFGVPNEEMGEEVKAVIQPVNMNEAGPALEAELISFCREHISHIKCPQSVDFEEELPRHPTGKLYKRLLKDKYWP
jgi:long-chain acyl-CoA synthetase